MIEYVEIREKATRKIIGIIDTAQSVIWKSLYYGVGDFEIYVEATPENIAFLSEGNYITRPNNYECGIIEHIEITDDSNDGKMIIASGRFVKSILSRRLTYSATLTGTGYNYIWSCVGNVLRGNVETAVRKLISDNAVDATDVNRNIPEIYWTNDDISGIPDIIVTEDSGGQTTAAEKQATYKNLLEYSDEVLQEYECGAKMWVDRELLKFRYKVFKGVDRSRDSTTNQPLIFSKDFDNLTSTTYTLDSSAYKTTALIGGDGEGVNRKCAFSYAWVSGLERFETFVDASSISSTYTDENEQEQTYTNEVYRKMLESQGRQTIAEMQKVETFDGEIDLTNTNLVYGTDYNLGDVITIEDKDIRKYINARITTVTEVQDENGYKIEIEYGI
nr:MAG TPA: hypothetical protein [Bacteriophage sp.]